SDDLGWYCPWLKYISLPTVKALAFSPWFICTASESVWIFTWLKSFPKRLDIKDLVDASNEEPPPLEDWMEWDRESGIVGTVDLLLVCTNGVMEKVNGLFCIFSSFSQWAHFRWIK